MTRGFAPGPCWRLCRLVTGSAKTCWGAHSPDSIAVTGEGGDKRKEGKGRGEERGLRRGRTGAP